MTDLIGKIVVIKRNGADGPQFPLRTSECLFGRKPECDIRIQLPNVSLEHAVVRVDNDRKIKLINLSSCNQTLVNGKEISQVEVQHLDVFTIGDRSFRFEFPSPVQKQAKEKSPKTQRRRSSTLVNTQQENVKTPKMPTPKGSPRTPPTGGSLKENIHRLRRYSMPLQEEEESLASPAGKTPFSMMAVNTKQQEENEDMHGSTELPSGRKSVGGEHKTKRRSKRVSFGPVLSPEQFDKYLPPATPVRRGATPKRTSDSSDHSLIPLCSSAKKRRSVIASPQTESIIEEDDQDASEGETPKTRMKFSSKMDSSEQEQGTHGVDTLELASQQFGTPKNSATPEECPTSSLRMDVVKMAESAVMEGDLEDTPKGRKQFSSNQVTPKNATPKSSRRSSSRLEENKFESSEKDPVSQKCATPIEYRQSASPLEEENAKATEINQDVVLAKDTPKGNRRSSLRLAGKSASLLELQSVQVPSTVAPHCQTASPSYCEEEDIDETILDSDDYTSDEEDAEGNTAIGKSTRLATPLRKEIEKGIKLQETKKKMVTPLKSEIASGIRLRQTKKRLATPLQKEIIDGTSLRQTKKKLKTPLRKEITEGIKLRETKKKLKTPIRKAIENGVTLRVSKKKMLTPLQKAIRAKPELRQTKKTMNSLLQNEIKQGSKLRKTKHTMPLEVQIEIIKGTKLRTTRKRLPTPLKKAISSGVTLRETKKSLPTPVKDEIKRGVMLQKTKKSLPTPMKDEIKRGMPLRKTKKGLPTPMKEEIKRGMQLQKTKKSLPTPMKKEIKRGMQLKKTKKSLPTPMKEEIKRGMQLQKTKKSLPTPVRRQLEKGVELKQSSKRTISEAGLQDTEPKKLKLSPSEGVNETNEEFKVATRRRALKTPLRKAIVAGTRLRATRHRMATPLRKQISSKHILRAIRRKSTAAAVTEKTVARKPTYAEIVKRPKKTGLRRLSRGPSFKFGKTAESFSKAEVIPHAKTADAVVTNPEIPRTPVTEVQSKERRKSTSVARKNTPQMKITKQDTPTFPTTNKKAQKNTWMSSLARATNGVKTRATPVEDLEGLSEMFATPPAAQITTKSFPKQQKAGNWLSSLAKATNGPRKRGMPVEDLEGVPEMFVTPPPATADVKIETSSPAEQELHMIEPLKLTKTPSLRSSKKDAEFIEIVTPIQSSCTPSLRSGKKQTIKTAVTPQAMLEIEDILQPKKTPSLRSSATDAITVQVVTPIQSSCTPSLRSGKTQAIKTAVTPQAMLEIEDILKPKKTPSLRSSAKDAITVQVVSPVQPCRTPSLRSAKKQSCVLTSECSDLELTFVQPIAPSKTPSMRSSAQVKAVSRKSVGNPSNDRKNLGLQELTRLKESPRENNAVENVEDFFVPNMFASPKPQTKRYSRKSEGLQGVTESPKLDGTKLASPNFVGLRILMKTPKTNEKHVDPEEHFSSELFASQAEDSSQDTAKSAARDRRDKKLSVPIIDLTSPETQARTANRARNTNSEAVPRATRAKRKAPEESTEPVPKRVCRTRLTVKQRSDSKPETRSNPKTEQQKTTTRSKKNTAAVIQGTPKPFAFKRTQLDPIIEVRSPLPSFDPIDITVSLSSSDVTEERSKRSATKTKMQSKAPLRSSRRGNRAKAQAESSLEESSKEEVAAEKCSATRSKKNERGEENSHKTGDTKKAAVKVTEPKAKETPSLSNMAPPVKTRATRSRRAEITEVEDEVEETVNNPTTRRSRRVAKTTEECVQVLEETKPTRSKRTQETRDKKEVVVPEIRCTRASRKPAHESKVVAKGNLARSTRGKKCGKEEVKEMDKEAKTEEIEASVEAKPTRRTRGNTADKAEGKVLPDNSAKNSRAKREVKGKTPNETRETRSTRSTKPAEDEMELSGEQSVRSTRGRKRILQEDAGTIAPAQSVNTRQTRSRSRK